MDFRTELRTEPLSRPIDYTMTGLSMGSCFAGNIARLMRRAKFPLADNPFGVLFNPFSIADGLGILDSGKTFTGGDMVEINGLWSSFSFHGAFSSPDRERALALMNEAVREGSRQLGRAGYVVITWGTAWVYELAGQPGRVVANCHKFPARMFTRRRLGVEEIIRRYGELLDTVLRDKHVIITVSPVRHLKDGFPGNSASKATLLLSAQALAEQYGNVDYFPAFELLNDDLRDYRFYCADMVHPSEQAIRYVWEKFRQAAFSPRTLEAVAEAEKIAATLEHRPSDADSAGYIAFRTNMLGKLALLRERFPEIDFSAETAHFGVTP